MSQKTETICDFCGARKGETNHWWKIEQGNLADWITIQPATEKSQPGADACSQTCAYQAITDFFDSINAKRKLEADERDFSDFSKESEEAFQEFEKANDTIGGGS